MSNGTFSVHPPDFIGPVDGYRCNNHSEWVASTIAKHTRCWYRRKLADTWTPATFLNAMFYDGVIAWVYEDDPDEYVKVTLFLGMGDELRATPP